MCSNICLELLTTAWRRIGGGRSVNTKCEPPFQHHLFKPHIVQHLRLQLASVLVCTKVQCVIVCMEERVITCVEEFHLILVDSAG